MQVHSDDAIVLSVLDLHEFDRIVTLITQGWGKKRGVARGSRKKYSRFAGQLRPLCKVRVRWFEKDNRELMRVNSVDLLRSAEPLQRDLEGILLGEYLAEHVVEFAQEDEPNNDMFRLLDVTLQALLDGVAPSLAARYFEFWVLRLSGLFPVPTSCPECGCELASSAVLPRGGETLICRRCGGKAAVELVPAAGTLELLRRMGATPLPELAAWQDRKTELDEIRAICAIIRRQFLQRELNSYRVIEETLGTAGTARPI